jgi:hypothetical protein
MLKFQVFDDGQPASSWPLRNTYITGADGNAMRCDIAFEDGLIICDKREAGSAALSIQYAVGELGELTLQTCLLPEREEPYLLALELARHRLMVVYSKLEDWAMFELDETHPVSRRSEKARRLFIEAMCYQAEEPSRAYKLADESLAAALDGSEELALAHSELLLNRRKQAGALPRSPVGCGVSLQAQDERLRAGLAAAFDYVQLPTPWKTLAPEENAYHWEQMDAGADWAQKSRKAVIAGPIVSFEPSCLPDWLYIWEHDYETVRDLIYEHIEKVVERYKGVVSAWNIVSGLHVNSHFSFNFEQLMDLTRMSTMLVKKLHPQGTTLVEIRQPFGEYYANNPRSIPPMMYVDLLIQSAIQFDAFSVRVPLGQAVDGQYTRDLMQVSSMLDQFAGLGKPLFVTLAAPSEPVTSVMIARTDSEEPADDNCGYWRRPWSTIVQGHWLEAAFQIAMSKPYVEAVAWQDLIDHQEAELPLSGLVSAMHQPKGSFKRLSHFRRNLQTAAAATTQPDTKTDPETEFDLEPPKRQPDPNT